jgi:hypothetical protein
MGRQRSLSAPRPYQGLRATGSAVTPAEGAVMPRVLNRSRPQFQLHDRHPALRGVAVLILALVFVAAFVATMPPGAP